MQNNKRLTGEAGSRKNSKQIILKKSILQHNSTKNSFEDLKIVKYWKPERRLKTNPKQEELWRQDLNKTKSKRNNTLVQEYDGNVHASQTLKKILNKPHITNISELKKHIKTNNQSMEEQFNKMNKLNQLKIKKRLLNRDISQQNNNQTNELNGNESIFQYCIRVNKDKLKYPELAILLERLEAKEKSFMQKKETKEVSIQTKQDKLVKKVTNIFDTKNNNSFYNELNQSNLKNNNKYLMTNSNNNNSRQSISIQTQDFNKEKKNQVIPTEKIKVRLQDMMFPQLPPLPSPHVNSKELLEVGKRLFELFKICKVGQISPITVQKYRNCIHFTTKSVHILWYDTGRFYIGEYKVNNKEGWKHGYGVQLLPGKSLYEGQFLANKKYGFGTLKFSNGNYYVGDFLDGLQHGKGKLFQNDECLYDGEWKQGDFDGFGKLILKNQQTYEGFFVKGLENGYGLLNFKNGDFYKGNFVDGKFSGLGKYRWNNGEIYQGEFSEGFRHGTGIWRSKRINGKFDQYCGEYQLDKKYGTGKYTWEGGKNYYQGQFQNDQKHGLGTLKENGKIIKGIWKHGVLKQVLSELINPDHPSRRFKLKSNSKHSKESLSPHANQKSPKFQRICGCKQQHTEQHPHNVKVATNQQKVKKLILKSKRGQSRKSESLIPIQKSPKEQNINHIQHSIQLSNLYN